MEIRISVDLEKAGKELSTFLSSVVERLGATVQEMLKIPGTAIAFEVKRGEEQG
ncbi:MAG: hypothetical protein QW356_03905 [Candidatus Hadarchaeales archaeon]